MKLNPKIVYSPHYDIKVFGIEKLHPFDSCKYSKIWKALKNKFGKRIENYLIKPERAVSNNELHWVHTDEYLSKLTSPTYLAKALEIPPLSLASLPLSIPLINIIARSLWKTYILDSILSPMMWATMGTIIAAEEALKNGFAVNLSGGYHHASQDRGEGFCLYSDIAMSISKLRQTNKITPGKDKVLIVDLDAHQGNGLERIYYNDKDVYILDMYNKNIYPQDTFAKQRINCDIPLPAKIKDQEYLSILSASLDDTIQNMERPKIAFYNAGTDIYKLDPLGNMNISMEGILQRDMMVFKKLSDSNIPCSMVLAGGYTIDSHRIVFNSLNRLIESCEQST